MPKKAKKKKKKNFEWVGEGRVGKEKIKYVFLFHLRMPIVSVYFWT